VRLQFGMTALVRDSAIRVEMATTLSRTLLGELVDWIPGSRADVSRETERRHRRSAY
jgi:hypothetical protein